MIYGIYGLLNIKKKNISPASFSLSNQIHYQWKVWPKFRYCLPGFHSSYHQLVLSCKQNLRAQAIHNNPTGKWGLNQNQNQFFLISQLTFFWMRFLVPWLTSCQPDFRTSSNWNERIACILRWLRNNSKLRQ